MKYVVELLEHDDIYGLCVGQTWRIYSYHEETGRLDEDIKDKSFYIRELDQSERTSTFEIDQKIFGDKAQAMRYFNEVEFTLEKTENNPVWNVVNNVIAPK